MDEEAEERVTGSDQGGYSPGVPIDSGGYPGVGDMARGCRELTHGPVTDGRLLNIRTFDIKSDGRSNGNTMQLVSLILVLKS